MSKEIKEIIPQLELVLDTVNLAYRNSLKIRTPNGGQIRAAIRPLLAQSQVAIEALLEQEQAQSNNSIPSGATTVGP